ncbi:MAG: aldo/keto reductase, partial [Gemmatimonadaceae bacterium]|nr:aldo/keto reductase [Chitinophagaceae bacterium]
ARIVASISGQKRSASRTAIEFVLSNPAVSAAIVGIRTAEQLEDVVGQTEETKLSTAEKNLLSQAVHANYYESHR